MGEGTLLPTADIDDVVRGWEQSLSIGRGDKINPTLSAAAEWLKKIGWLKQEVMRFLRGQDFRVEGCCRISVFGPISMTRKKLRDHG